MVSRPYRCPLCHCTFRNESGAKWHLIHRHEITNAFDILGKDYNVKAKSLEDENASLRQTLERVEISLSDSRLVHLQELAGRIQDLAEIKRLNRVLRRAMLGLLARDILIKRDLNTALPDPFLE